MARKLWSKQRKSRYKTVDNWLDSVYRKNKEKIDAAIEQPTNPKMNKKEVFKELVKEYHEEGHNWSKSLQLYERSTNYTSTAERLKSNAYKALVSDDIETYRRFRNLTKIKGRYTSIDWDNVKWDADSKSYIYHNKIWDEESKSYKTYNVIRISFQNSPKETIVEELEDDDYE